MKGPQVVGISRSAAPRKSFHKSSIQIPPPQSEIPSGRSGAASLHRDQSQISDRLINADRSWVVGKVEGGSWGCLNGRVIAETPAGSNERINKSVCIEH